MISGLSDLLAKMREHPAFPELLKQVEAPQIKGFRQGDSADAQTADWIFRSGRRLQDQLWRQFLTGSEPSQQEKS